MALRILLADDSMTAQNMGKKILTDAGFDVVTVSNGAAAVKKLAESSPDIAVLDVYMPGYTGLEVCERMKSSPATAHVPVLLSVGKMEPFRPEDGMKVKADGVIIKPFEATDLVTVVQKLIERSYGPNAQPVDAVPADAGANDEDMADILEESAPVKDTTTEALQTFAPVADSGQAVAQEPNIEFTSVPKTGAILDEPLQDLIPTVLQPESATHEPDTAAMAHVQELPETAARAVAAGAETAQEAPLEYEAVSAAPAVAGPSANEVEVANDVNWNAVEAEAVDQAIDLDLEAEMQAVVQEQAMHDLSSANPQHAETAPFLSPLGKTSFDELDAIMEQTSAVQPDAPPAVPVEDALETVLLPEAVADDAVIDPLAASDELLSPLDNEAEPTVIAPGVQVADEVQEESVLETDCAAGEAETAPVESVEEVLETATEEEPQSPPAADAAAVSAMAYYGLLDDEPEVILQNTVEETGEPLLIESTALDEPLAGLQSGDSMTGEQLSGDLLPADEVRAEAGIAEVAEERLIAEEVVADGAPVADAADVLEDVAVDPVLEDVAEPVLSEDVENLLPADAVVRDSEPNAPAPMEEIAAPVAIPAAAAVAEQPAQASAAAAAAPAPAVDDAMVNGMVGRVVDRVVDRLKPILAVMVEEILHEIKK